MSETTLATATKEQLLEAAEKLGIVADGRWGEDRLRTAIEEELEVRKVATAAAEKNAARLAEEAQAEEAAKNASMPNLAAVVAAESVAAAEAAAEPVAETPGQRQRRIRDACMKLVRVNISCMDPAKAKYKGELICVSNRNIGTVQRFIPFNRDWHVEQVLLDALLDKEYLVFDAEKTQRAGIEIKTPRGVKAFNIRILPPLTEDELAKLAQRQAMADGTKV